jgi:hypothetical protein
MANKKVWLITSAGRGKDNEMSYCALSLYLGPRCRCGD